MSDDPADMVSQTDLLRAFEATVGRADRKRLGVAADPQISAGERELWVVDGMDVQVDAQGAQVTASNDDVMLPRGNLAVSLKFSLKRSSAVSPGKGE